MNKVSPCFKIDKKKVECEKIFTFDPEDPEFCGFLHYGKALFICTLSDITTFEKEHERDAWVTYMPNHFAWHLTNVRPVEPFNIKGKLNFFEVNDNLIKLIS
jgi:hypothetical protein